MEDRISQLKKKIEEIEALKKASAWGAEFQLWKDMTDKLVKEIFGEEGLKLFSGQQSVVLDDEAYIQELDSRKKMLEGLLANRQQYKPRPQRKRWMESDPSDTFTSIISGIFSLIFGLLYLIWRLIYMIISFVAKLIKDILNAAYQKVVGHFGTALAVIVIGAILYMLHSFAHF